MDNINDEEGDLIIIDIDNKENKYISINKYPYVLSKNSIILLQTKENPNNYIFLCATKKLKDNQKNGLLAFNINIEKPFYKGILESFYDINNFRINSMTICERGNNDNEKNSALFLVGGNIDSYDFEIRLFKIMYLDGNKNDYVFLECIKKVIYYKDIQKCYSYIVQSIANGQLIFSSNYEIYLYRIRTEVEKEEKKKYLLHNSSDN